MTARSSRSSSPSPTRTRPPTAGTWTDRPRRSRLLLAPAVEREVAAEYEERTGVAVEVRCPEEMLRNSGEVHPCEGARTDGDVVYIEIQIADPGEDVDYHWWTPPA